MVNGISKPKATATAKTGQLMFPTNEYDSNSIWNTGQGVPEDLVLGKVVMRLPFFGHITLFLQKNSWGLPVIIALIILLLLVEFILPIIKPKKVKPAEEAGAGEVQQFTLVSG